MPASRKISPSPANAICSMCGKEFDRATSPYSGRCKVCRNAADYLLRKQRPGQAKKMLARVRARQAIRRGKLKRQPCEVCANPVTEAHHDDYSKPLDVRWLCTEHHRMLHGRQKYPWEKMKVGDNFHVPGVTSSKLSQAARMHVKRRNNGWMFSARSENNGARIWRTA